MKKYPFYDFIASLCFVFDVDWDTDFADEPEYAAKSPLIELLPIHHTEEKSVG